MGYKMVKMSFVPLVTGGEASSFSLPESRFNYDKLYFQCGYNNDGFTWNEIDVNANDTYFTLRYGCGAGNDMHDIIQTWKWNNSTDCAFFANKCTNWQPTTNTYNNFSGSSYTHRIRAIYGLKVEEE